MCLKRHVHVTLHIGVDDAEDTTARVLEDICNVCDDLVLCPAPHRDFRKYTMTRLTIRSRFGCQLPVVLKTCAVPEGGTVPFYEYRYRRTFRRYCGMGTNSNHNCRMAEQLKHSHLHAANA